MAIVSLASCSPLECLMEAPLHEEGTTQVDLGVTQRYDSRGDRPHTHQPKMCDIETCAWIL
ncbi:hypothetical protein OESDEN_04150 [Oesophagostomum dentatum]|uniref:Uncharacterized protein n=1 Tax=Oesophagostomum dentatum TaxID=61180 RepID=A0A0B1TEA3_OESDE|nr:hypothetical protein OESDEN_04150 [Oesophagostomum dentatum]